MPYKLNLGKTHMVDSKLYLLLLREFTHTSLFILLANREIRILDRIATPAGIRVGEVPIVAIVSRFESICPSRENRT